MVIQHESLSSYYRLTTIGAYYFRKLVSIFQYLDAVVVDTPVVDSVARSAIGDASTIQARLSRAEQFCDYLDSQWDDLGDAGALFDWPGTLADARREIERIRTSIASRPQQPRLR